MIERIKKHLFDKKQKSQEEEAIEEFLEDVRPELRKLMIRKMGEHGIESLKFSLDIYSKDLEWVE